MGDLIFRVKDEIILELLGISMILTIKMKEEIKMKN